MDTNISELNSTHTKLTDWKKEPSVTTLREDFQLAQPAHDDHVIKVQEWLDLRNGEGAAKPKTGANRSKVQPKLIRKTAEWRYAALTEPFLSADDLYSVSPKTFEDKQGAVQNSQILEWQFRTKINRVRFIDEFVRTTVDEGTSVIRVGWERATTMEDVEVPVWQFEEVMHEEQMAALQQAMSLQAENPNEFKNLDPALQEAALYTQEAGIPVVAVQVGIEIQQEEKILENCPTLEIVDYRNFYLDPTCAGDVSKARFAIYSFETSKAELIKDGRYKNLKAINWDGHDPLTEPHHESDETSAPQFKDAARKRVVAYEYWGWFDVEGNDELIPIVATWIGDTMIRMEMNPFPDEELPFVVVPYMPIKRSVTGEPDAELLGDNQAIQGALTRGIIDLMGRSANSQTGFAKGMLDPVNRRRYDKGVDYEFNPNVHPTNAIHQHQFPEIPNSALTMLSVQNQEAEAMTGVKAFSSGLSGESFGEVAAGIRGVLDASSKREMSILRRLAQGIECVGAKIVTMNQLFLSDEETIRITNEQYTTIRREDLSGEYDLIVDITTAEINEGKAQDLSFMLQTMGNNMDFSMVQIILGEIARLKKMPVLAHKIENFQPQPDPMEEQIKQLEAQKLQMEIAEIQSKVQLNQAKARAELSEADLKDLDFVETETGTKHERTMDEHSAQAQSNIELELVKGLMGENKAGSVQ